MRQIFGSQPGRYSRDHSFSAAGLLTILRLAGSNSTVLLVRQAMLAKWQSRVLTCASPISEFSFSPCRIAFTKLLKWGPSLPGAVLVSSSLPFRSWMVKLLPVVQERTPPSP